VSNITLFSNSSAVPAHIAQRELSKATLALAGTGTTVKRISIEGGVFRMMVGGKEVAKNTDRSMNVVVVSTAPANSRIYYDPAVPYVRGQASAPTCSSSDGVRPNVGTKNPQAATCASCPQNVSGSGQGESRACRYQRRLAVVLEGDMSGDVYQVILPATSIFGRGQGTQNLPLEAYARMLHSNRVGVDSVVTKMEFDTDSSTPKLVFSPVRYVSEQEQAIIDSQAETPEADQAIGLNAYQTDTAAKPVALPAATPAPAVVDEPAAEEAPAPKAKATKAPKASGGFVPTSDDAPAVDDPEVPPPTKAAVDPESRAAKIGNVLAAWGDE
jgi:hypothetical protein